MLSGIRRFTRWHFVSLLILLFFTSTCGRGTHPSPTVLQDISTAQDNVLSSQVQNVDTRKIKLGLSKQGVYEISSADIARYQSDWVNVDPTRFRITLRGISQPVWVSNTGKDYNLVFYGMASESRYTEENYYMLSVDGAKPQPMQVKQTTASGQDATDIVSSTLHLEQNNLYAPQVKEGDHFFWFSLPGNNKKNIDIPLTKLANGPGRLKIAVWGSTESPVKMDHHLVVSLNDTSLIDEKWDGAGRQVLTAAVPSGLLKEKNVLEISAPGDTGAAAEINYLDWIEVQYSQQAQADQDFLAFGVPQDLAGTAIRLSKFSGSILVLDVTLPTQTVRITASTNDKEMLFTGEADHHYVAIGPKGYLKPISFSPVATIPDLRAEGSGADYLVIGPEDLLQPLSSFLAWKNSQGLKTIAVALQTVYDQFNQGMPEPEAIQAFMIYASQKWIPAPRYLLLVGDATYDPRGYISKPEANRLPVFFIQTVYGGETGSDVLFGDVNSDLRPDLAVGRVPAQTVDQVRIWAEKTIAYEQDTKMEDWRLRVLAIADGQDASFKADAQAFLDQITTPYTGTLYAPKAGVTNAPTQVESYIDDGYGLISYFGHGSVNMWGKDKIFMADDVSSLSNRERLPIVVNMTCLTGFFIHPKVNSLMETLLWDEGGGAVAMLAPTSLTLPSYQNYLSQALIHAWMQTSGGTLGDIYLQAQQQVPVDNSGGRDVLLTFLLFGDPALQISGK